MKEWDEFEPSEIVRKYRQFVYETGAVNTGKGKAMDPKILAREMDSTWGQVVCSCSKRETDRRAEAHGRGPPRRPAKNGLTWRTISRQNRP
jgi:hypothetical protein